MATLPMSNNQHSGKTMPLSPDNLTRNHSPAQLMIEAIIAMAVVSIVLVALVSLSLRALRVQISNRQTEQATQVEQAAMEGLRQIRDGFGVIKTTEEPDGIGWVWENETVWTNDCEIEGESWTCFRLYYDYVDSQWVLERVDSSDNIDPVAPVYRLHFQLAENRYGYPGLGGFPEEAPAGIFYRQILIRDRPPDSQLPFHRSKEVLVNLSWQDGNRARQSKIVSILSAWTVEDQ